MATAQMQRNFMSAVAFPNTISTEQQSLVLVKRLLAVSISCITYLRGIFPECAYGTRYLDDLCVKVLRKDRNCPGSTQLVKWLLGCHDALQKKYVTFYVRYITLIFYLCFKTISECYQFKFKYTSNGPVMDLTSKGSSSNLSSSDTKKASILLIRKIYILMQNLGPLPNDVCLTMKLFYYDEVTPPDYQPPGFKEGDCEGVIFDGEPMYLNVGEVPTAFHTLKVKVTTEKERMEDIDKAILTQKQLKTPLQKILMDKEDLEAQEQFMNVRFVKEDEIMRSEESPNLSISHSQVEQLINKTSELHVSGSRTRSGKVFQNSMVSTSFRMKSVCNTTVHLNPYESILEGSFKETTQKSRGSEAQDFPWVS
uniref:HORMA domain-containing protein 1 n=1 Tax=Vombatus ursinus TaxID=29139 RepID=A0A4X2JMS2_VOMUR